MNLVFSCCFYNQWTFMVSWVCSAINGRLSSCPLSKVDLSKVDLSKVDLSKLCLMPALAGDTHLVSLSRAAPFPHPENPTLCMKAPEIPIWLCGMCWILPVCFTLLPFHQYLLPFNSSRTFRDTDWPISAWRKYQILFVYFWPPLFPPKL